jgi:hypothetical protein
VATASTCLQPNPAALARIDDLFLHVESPASAARLWERVLTDRERQDLGGDFEQCYARLKTVGMWTELRGVSRRRAIIDISPEHWLIDESTFQWLLREIGEAPAVQKTAVCPQWQASTGTLRLGRRVIRKVRLTNPPANIQLILNAFQDARWASRINNPLRLGQQQLHQALRTLHKGLGKIRFHSLNGGKAISWEIA